MPVMRIDNDGRRARLAVRHHLAAPARAKGVVEVASDLVALHATDPASVHLAALARMRDGTAATVERALYDDRVLVRALGMRRTVFVLPVELLPVVQAACTDEIAARERRRTVQFLQEAGVSADVPAWLAEVEAATVRALAVRGEATGAELAGDEARLRTVVPYAVGTAYESRQNITTRVLALLAAEGRIVRGRPRGSWISSQYRWSLASAWFPGGIPAVPADEARVELARRYLARFGPATRADLKWWTGWTAGQVAKTLARIATTEVGLADGTGLVLAGDLDTPPAMPPWAALLPALDPTPMGWAGRRWFLGEHTSALFDRSGNIGPTIWWNGRIVGGWAQRPDATVAYRLLEDVGAEGRAAVRSEVARIQAILDGTRVTPRFRTPLERELSTAGTGYQASQ
ncbi:MAG: AlkZ family DNA glycosylase [Jiangellaceae bacterium]|nr:AlkZ family DNA glycosylase [Jiangellaceae bacterium]